MSIDTLSQSEIDQLFSGGGSADAPAPVAEQQPEVQLYDFRRPSRISKDRLRSLEALYGLVAKSVEGWMTARIRTPVELRLQSVDQLSYGEFLLSLSTPCASYVYDTAEDGPQSVVDLGQDFAFFLLERLLGGVGQPAPQDRPLTVLERQVVRIAADKIAQQLSEVWQDHVRMDMKLSRFESMPDMLQIANQEDPVLVANFAVRGPGVDSSLFLCLPLTLLETYFSGASQQRIKVSGARGAERQMERQGLELSLRGANLPLAVRLPATTLTLRELASLHVGGLLATGLPPDCGVEIYVAGQRRFVGAAGRVAQKLAVRITDVVEDSLIESA